MNEKTVVLPPAWKRSRYGFAGFWLLSLMAAWSVLRLILFAAFKPAGVSPLECGLAFLSGLARDGMVALWMTLPLLFWVLLLPYNWFRSRWHRGFFWSAAFVTAFLSIFLLFVEYFFFDEFRSRFNTVAVDYLEFPQEVFINIWQSYHVGVVVSICGVLALGWVWVASRLFRGMWENAFGGNLRALRAFALAALAAFFVPILALASAVLGVWSDPVSPPGAHVSSNRTLNEIANNGTLTFFAAGLTRHLDYSAFYKVTAKEQAYERARRLLTAPNSRFVEPGQSIRRQIAGDSNRPRLNVVLFLEESLGSEFWGSLGRKEPTLTPEMDKLAADEGLLFTNIYASGNRTVRGMEGVLSSFPPLPGDSIVKRNFSDNVETIARVLKRDGYSTVFLYGGRGVFDGMRSFAVRNGYDRFIEQKDFLQPAFTTIWGVCDEELFARGIQEFRELDKTGKPFFGTLLSVSNHKPYTYPKGRIAEDPEQRRRENAVKYSDFALGEFFRAARKEAFWTNTIFVVVADHGARVYGSQSIPIHSYEIPLLIAGPAVVKQPVRNGQLGCSLDVTPTILGMLGRPYETMFFGRDLLKCAPSDGRALLNHNRDIGILAGDRLAVLGLMQTSEFYAGNPKEVEMKLMSNPGKPEQEALENAMALFQVADDLYIHEHYNIDRPAPAK